MVLATAEAVLRLSKMATNAAVASSAALMRTILAILRPWLTVLEVAELAATGVSVGAGVKSIEVGVAVTLGKYLAADSSNSTVPRTIP